MLIYPFRGILYNKKKINRLGSVYSPPYDVISPEQRDDYYKASPYNIIRVILNKPIPKDNKKNKTYTRAANYFNQWRKKGILKQDIKPAIYIYGQEFKYKNRIRRTLGFIALSQIGDSPQTEVLAHEKTFKAPCLDRERLLASVGANTCCIYTLFQDKGLKVDKLLRQASRKKPFIDIKKDCVRHRMWKVADNGLIKRLQNLMSNKKVFIADGHHRYQAAVNFRNRMQKADKNFTKNSPYNYIMMYFVSLEDKGLTILATHRLLKHLGSLSVKKFKERLEDFFQTRGVQNQEKMFEALDNHFGKEHIFGLYLDREFTVLKLKDKRFEDKLDVAILHKIVFEKILSIDSSYQKQDEMIFYTNESDVAVRLVDEGEFKVAFFLNPTMAKEVRDVSLASERMPHKSTYFYPKPLTGLVMRSFEES